MTIAIRKLTAAAALALALAFMLPPAAEAEPRTFVWRGHDTASFLPNDDFQTFLRRAMKAPSMAVADQPDKQAVLDGLVGADIVYTNTHGGFLKDTGVHVMQTGPRSDGFGWVVRGRDILELRKAHGDAALPRLIVVAGCDLISPLPAGAQDVRIPDAFGFLQPQAGRAFVGFDRKITGAHVDRFFRWFFATWTKQKDDGSYPTLAEAVDLTKAFILAWTETRKDSAKLYMTRNDAKYADDIIILGDESLRFPDLE